MKGPFTRGFLAVVLTFHICFKPLRIGVTEIPPLQCIQSLFIGSLSGFIYLYFNILLFMLLQLSQFSAFAPLHFPTSYFLRQSQHHCPWVVHICSLAIPFTFFQPVPPCSLPLYSCQSAPCFYASDSILLISLFSSLDFTYKLDYMVFVFH